LTFTAVRPALAALKNNRVKNNDQAASLILLARQRLWSMRLTSKSSTARKPNRLTTYRAVW
jgi:hypothetical protein